MARKMPQRVNTASMEKRAMTDEIGYINIAIFPATIAIGTA